MKRATLKEKRLKNACAGTAWRLLPTPTLVEVMRAMTEEPMRSPMEQREPGFESLFGESSKQQELF